MIQLKNINFGYGGQTLMSGLELHIRTGDRLGLVGPNGAGKTTLLRIINGEIQGFEGEVSRRRGIVTGLLPQEGIYDSGRSVFDAALSSFSRLLDIESKMESLNHDIETATGTHCDELLERIGTLRSEYEIAGGFTFRADTARVLTGLGFREADFTRDIGTFSGGWQMRVALARLLLQKPDILLLDEPTNHLDLPAIIWFENFLNNYPGAVVVISHDPCFLDRMVSRIVEFSQRRLDAYTGNYSTYRVEKEKRRELLLSRYENQQRVIRHNEKFIERFRYKNTKASSVQSRIKKLDKIDRIELPAAERTLKFSFRTRVRSGKVVMTLQDINKSYGDNHVLKNVSLTVNRGDRLAIIGANGLGKTTLMRVLAGATDFQGERTPGHNVLLNYFSQDQYEMLNPDRSVLEEATSACGPDFQGSIRTLLGVFLFHGDDVDKPVRVLSGGEKSRLLLARSMADPANFLILDEPTNHLDPPSQEMLRDVLLNYNGTLCLVSHSRYFINAVANRIVEFTPNGIEEYIGNYEDYEEMKELRAAGRGAGAAAALTTPESGRKEQRRERARFVAERSRVLSPIRKAIEKAETKIQKLESRAMEIEALLSNPETYTDPEKTKALPAELKQVKSDLDEVLLKWEQLNDELDEKQTEFEDG